MLGSRARCWAALGLLSLTQGGCQSWFLIKSGDLMPRWEELRREGAQVDLYVEVPPSTPVAVSAAAAGTATASTTAPGGAKPVPLSRVSLAELLPTRPPFLVGRREPDQLRVVIDSRRVAYAHALRDDPKKTLLGLGIGVGSVVLLGATTAALYFLVQYSLPRCLGHPCGI